MWVYTGIELLAVALCFARARQRREDRTAWLLIAAGLLAWTGGDFVWTVWLGNLANPPYPSVADGLYLALYPATYAGLVLLMRAHFRHTGFAVWLDGIVVGLTLAALGADLIFPAVLRAASGNDASVGVNLAYPFGDLLLLVFIAVGFALSGWRPGRQWLLLGVGIAVNAVADMLYVYQVAKGTYVEGNLLDTMWPASMVVVAFAAWQPTPARRNRGVVGGHTIILPAAFALMSLGLLVSSSLHPLTQLAVALATLALLAAGTRAGLTYVENVRMLRRQTREATTDALTRLANRRQLMGDLETSLDRARPAAWRRSRSSTWMASSATTTASVTAPATPCWCAWAKRWRTRSKAKGRPTGWAATSSACCCRVASRATPTSSSEPAIRCPSTAAVSP